MSVNDYDHDLYELIVELVAEGKLEEETPAYGISQQVIHMGYDSLSAKQKYIYDTRVVPLFAGITEQHAVNARTYNAQISRTVACRDRDGGPGDHAA